ncbi:MAG: alpha-glucan family phosphorylase, partial [Anaerolineae bacterium]
MKNIQLFNVAPSLPQEIRFLEQLAGNLWWSWNSDAIDLFRRIDPDLWAVSRHNPLKFFCEISPERLAELREDSGFLTHMEAVRERFEAEVLEPEAAAGQADRGGVAYFSLEFGIHESVRIYSGGLGCLAGDHLKSASDLGLPLLAVGLLYRQGYFQQYLDDDGWQQESYPEIVPHHVPIVKMTGQDGQPIEVSLPLPDGEVKLWVWRMLVGRVSLFLLDANLPANAPAHRRITAQLYGGDRVNRIRQELVLGIGGVRA